MLYTIVSCNLSDSKSPQVSRALVSILADLKNPVVSIVLFCPPISSFFSPLFQVFGERSKFSNYDWYYRLPRVSQHFSSLAKSKYLVLFSLALVFSLWPAGI